MANMNQVTTADPEASGTFSSTSQVPEQTQDKDPPVKTRTPDVSTEVYTKTDVDAMLTKARQDEKSKVYGQLDALKVQKELSEKKAQELEAKLLSLEKDLDNVRQGKKSEIESVTQELATLRDHNKKLEKAVEEVASTATYQIRQAQLDAYREKLITEKGIIFSDSIKGDSKEEILESAEEALKKQRQVEETARKKALEEAQREMRSNLPRPLVVDGQVGKGSNPVAGPSNRESLARLPDDEYRTIRAQLLKDAKQKVGLQE